MFGFLKAYLRFIFSLMWMLCVAAIAIPAVISYSWHHFGVSLAEESLPSTRGLVDENAEVFEKVSYFVKENRVNAISWFGTGFDVNFQDGWWESVLKIEGLNAVENQKFQNMFLSGGLYMVWNQSDDRICHFDYIKYGVAKVLKWNGPPIGKQYVMKIPMEYRNGLLILSNCNRFLCNVEGRPSDYSNYQESDHSWWIKTVFH